jgi:hypothetical protein
VRFVSSYVERYHSLKEERTMTMWSILALVCVAGAIGGLVNALLTNNGFPLPSKYQIDGRCIIQPGAIGNVLLGAIAAAVSFGLYGSLSNQPIIGTAQVNPPILTVASLVGAVLVGVGGARLFTSEADKQLFQAAASQMAGTAPDPTTAERIMRATPVEALKIASAMPSSIPGVEDPKPTDGAAAINSTVR